MAERKWFKKAVEKKPPYSLGGWKKSQSTTVRRRKALSSRPKNWTRRHRYRSAGQSLTALANVTQDKRTEELARRDARYFFSKLKKMS